MFYPSRAGSRLLRLAALPEFGTGGIRRSVGHKNIRKTPSVSLGLTMAARSKTALDILIQRDLVPIIFGQPFPKDTSRLFRPERERKFACELGPPRSECMINSEDFDEYLVWVQQMAVLRYVCRAMMKFYGLIMNEALWFDHPTQLEVFLARRQLPPSSTQLERVRFLRLDFAWVADETVWECDDLRHWSDPRDGLRTVCARVGRFPDPRLAFLEVKVSGLICFPCSWRRLM
jgi:hypothetical protein